MLRGELSGAVLGSGRGEPGADLDGVAVDGDRLPGLGGAAFRGGGTARGAARSGRTCGGLRGAAPGFGPWARIYRPATAGRRQCVQLAVLPWGALNPRSWGNI